jgi:hypothetical protein
MTVGADIGHAGIVTPDDKDVGLVGRISRAGESTKPEHQCHDYKRCGGSFHELFHNVLLLFHID